MKRFSRETNWVPFFSLALQPILVPISNNTDSKSCPSYLDDTIPMGPKEEVFAAYSVIKKDFNKIGLQLKEGKCKAYTPSKVNSNRFVILGTPVGIGDYVSKSCLKMTRGGETFSRSAMVSPYLVN